MKGLDQITFYVAWATFAVGILKLASLLLHARLQIPGSIEVWLLASISCSMLRKG